VRFGNYGLSLTEEERKNSYDLRQIINKLNLFQLLQKQLGVEFKPEIQVIDIFFLQFSSPRIRSSSKRIQKSSIQLLVLSQKTTFTPLTFAQSISLLQNWRKIQSLSLISCPTTHKRNPSIMIKKFTSSNKPSPMIVITPSHT